MLAASLRARPILRAARLSAMASRAIATSPMCANAAKTGATTPRADAKNQLLTLSEIDKLLTHIAREQGGADGV